MMDIWWLGSRDMVATWQRYGSYVAQIWWLHGRDMAEIWWLHGGDMMYVMEI